MTTQWPEDRDPRETNTQKNSSKSLNDLSRFANKSEIKNTRLILIMFSSIPSFFEIRVSASCQLFDISIQIKIKELLLSRESVCLQFQHKDPHCVKSIRVRSFSVLHFPAFGLNTEICGVNLSIQSKCAEIRTRKTPNTETF